MNTRVGILPVMMASLFVAWGCGQSDGDSPKESLTGKVMFDDKPVSMATVVAIGSDQKEVSAQSDDNGEYRLANPPHGSLKFQVYTIPPAPPGVKSGPMPPGMTKLPAKYSKPDNELSYDFQGGNQTYDITLKP